jgi:gamma-glutamylcyclotransferase
MAGVSEKKAFSGFSELVFQNGIAGELHYFAYGSHMNNEQMLARGAKPKVVGAAKLPDHQLAFFDYSAVWDGAEETVVPAPGHDVWGVVYELSPSDRERLDDAQDARLDGSGAYFHSPAKVTDREGKVYTVLLYKKDKLGIPQKPSQEYLNFIVQGAEAHELPSAYVETLRTMESRKAEFVVPRQRRSPASGGDCSQCGDAPDASGSVINISLGSGSHS